MYGYSILFGGFKRALIILFIVLVGFSVLVDDPSNGGNAFGGVACSALTSNADVNRVLCKLHPTHLWNMPVSDLIPAWVQDLL